MTYTKENDNFVMTFYLFRSVFGAFTWNTRSKLRFSLFRPGFLNLNTFDFGGWKSLCCGGLSCRMHPCRIFSSISGLCPLDASRAFLVVTTKYISRHFQIWLEGQKSPLVENCWSRVGILPIAGINRTDSYLVE